MSGTWTTEYAPDGTIVDITSSTFTLSGTTGTTTFTEAGALPYANTPADGPYEMVFVGGGSGGPYSYLYVDWTGETLTTLEVDGGNGRFTSVVENGNGQNPVHLAAGGAVTDAGGPPCYCRGTQILTDRGEVAVDDLRIGDLLITRSGEARALRWIGKRSYSRRFIDANPTVQPVRISRDALADNVPRRDLLVSPAHAMLLNDVLVPALALVNGSSIVQVAGLEQVEYFHLELDTHDVIQAEGAPSETFVDDGSRNMFQNSAEYRALYPVRRSDRPASARRASRRAIYWKRYVIASPPACAPRRPSRPRRHQESFAAG